MPVNYVKFMRGTEAVYNSLATKDSDTLYFVYTTAGSETGKLYLGNKLISGSSSVDGNISITDIADVAIDSGVTSGDVLVYNASTQKWESMPITDALGMDEMVGATALEDGIAGLVPVPQAGDQGKFLRGDGSWVTVTGSLSPEDLESIELLQSQVATLIGDDEDLSVAEIAASQMAALLIPENARASLDSLQEIADWIQSHPDDVAQINSDISSLQSDVSDLTDLLNGTQQESGLVSRVSALETTMGTFTPVQGTYLNVGEAISYLDNSVLQINERLRWHELTTNNG